MASLSSVSNKQIQIAVIIKVSPCRSMLISRWPNPRGRKDIRKRSSPIILVKVGRRVIMIVNEEVEIPIAIEVTPDGVSEGKSHRVEPGRDRGISKDWANLGSPCGRCQLCC